MDDKVGWEARELAEKIVAAVQTEEVVRGGAIEWVVRALIETWLRAHQHTDVAPCLWCKGTRLRCADCGGPRTDVASAKAEAQAKLEAVCAALNRQPVSDFMLSFSVVRGVIETVEAAHSSLWLTNERERFQLEVERLESELAVVRGERDAAREEFLEARDTSYLERAEKAESELSALRISNEQLKQERNDARRFWDHYEAQAKTLGEQMWMQSQELVALRSKTDALVKVARRAQRAMRLFRLRSQIVHLIIEESNLEQALAQFSDPDTPERGEGSAGGEEK